MAVDFERRRRILSFGQNQAQAAALKRLCARANNSKAPANSSSRNGLDSFQTFAQGIIRRLKDCGVNIGRGLTEEEVARIEAEFYFTFPPDLKAVLQEGLPVGTGFPDWRCLEQMKMRMNVAVAGISYEVARGKFWASKQWGPRPSNGEMAANVARVALRKAPVLVPIYSHCYIPSSPVLAGNPIFWVYQSEVLCCGVDLADFFHREAFITDASCKSVVRKNLRRERSVSRHELKDGDESAKCSDVSSVDWLDRKSFEHQHKQIRVLGLPRWIDFWTDLAEKGCSSVSSSPNIEEENTIVIAGTNEAEKADLKVPKWLNSYMEELASLLRNGGWKEEDINEMIVCPNDSGCAETDETQNGLMFIDSQAILEGILLKADSMSESLRRAGWTSQDLSEVFDFDFGICNKERFMKRHPKEISDVFVQKISKILST